MTKYACPDCDATFTAPTDTETVRCPGCGEMVWQQPAPALSRAYPDCERCGDTGLDPEGANEPCADCQPTAPAVSSQLPDQTLRDRLVAAIKASPFDELRTVDYAPNGPLLIKVKVDDLADTLMRRLPAVLPPAADRSAVEEQFGEQLDEAGATIAQQTAALAQADERVEFYEAAHARMRDRLEVTRVRVQRLHSPGANGECQHCHHSSPCPTVQALDDPADAELRRLAAEAQQQPEPEAHEPEHSWAAELYDPVADEWVPGTRYLVRARAVNHLAHARSIGPTWKDGTPVERRLVRATTTYTVEQPAAADTGEEAEA